MDIYKTPEADLSNESSSKHVKLYTPNQVAGGAALGGPIGIMYFLCANFNALSNSSGKKKTILFTSVFLFTISVIVPLFKINIPGTIFTLGYIITARYVAENHQMTKNKIVNYDEYSAYSTWRVLFIGAISLALSFLIITGPAVVFSNFGWLK